MVVKSINLCPDGHISMHHNYVSYVASKKTKKKTVCVDLRGVSKSHLNKCFVKLHILYLLVLVLVTRARLFPSKYNHFKVVISTISVSCCLATPNGSRWYLWDHISHKSKQCPGWRSHSFLDCLPSSECQICFFFFGFWLIFEVVSVVIDLFFVSSVDYRLLTEKKTLYTLCLLR